MLDSLGAKGKDRLELRRALFSLFVIEHPEIKCSRAKDLDYPSFLLYIKWVDMILLTEFGMEVELPNQKGTKNMNLSEYLNFLYENNK